MAIKFLNDIDVDGGARVADDPSAASASNVGTLRYRVVATRSYVDLGLQTGAGPDYSWGNIVQNAWT